MYNYKSSTSQKITACRGFSKNKITDMSKYNVNGLPWRNGLGKDVTMCETSAEVNKTAGLDWTVDKCPLVAKMPFGIGRNNEIDEDSFAHNGKIYRDCPKAFATYRTDINEPLGIVKSQYEIVQNADAFNFFDEAIGEGGATWDRAGYFGYGNKVFVTAKLNIDSDVEGDKINNYLVFSNSHDGSGSVNILLSPIRVICTNMLNGALMKNDCYIRLRHTKTVKERLEIGTQVLKVACKRARSAQELYREMSKIKLDDGAVIKYLANINLNDEEQAKLMSYDSKHGYDRLVNKEYRCLESTGISTRKANIISGMYEYYNDGIGQKDIYGNGWGAYNAVTGFYSNVANLEGEKRMESLIWGSANNNMLKAANEVMKLAI